MERRPRWILSFLVIFCTLLAVDYFFLHFLFPLKRAAVMEELGRKVEESLERNPPNLPDPSPSVPTPDTPPVHEPSLSPAAPGAALPQDSFRQAVRTCFDNAESDVNPTDLVRHLETSRGLTSRDTPVENWHLARPDGSEERLMLVWSDRANAAGKKEVRLFDVDDEGLPVPQKLDARRAYNPSPEYVESLKARGEVLFHQRRELLKFADGTSASVEWVDGSVREMQIFLAARTLSCLNLDCRCL